MGKDTKAPNYADLKFHPPSSDTRGRMAADSIDNRKVCMERYPYEDSTPEDDKQRNLCYEQRQNGYRGAGRGGDGRGKRNDNGYREPPRDDQW